MVTGVGKTVFTQGFAKGLGIEETVNSPTFTIIQVYDEGRIPLYHFDVYRIGDPGKKQEIGYEDISFKVCLIEWSKLIEELIPSDAATVLIEKDLERSDYERLLGRTMRILAIDSSSKWQQNIKTDSVLNSMNIQLITKTHSQTLLPMIDEIKKNIDLI